MNPSYPSYYKYCMVPQCKSTNVKTPNKLFIFVPSKQEIRIKWLTLARRNDAHCLSTNSRMYFCEDHFDLPNDMLNYIEYHIMGKVSQVRMKPGCTPSKFECQEDRRTRTCSSAERPHMLKKQRMEITPECLKENTNTECLEKPEESCLQSPRLKDVPHTSSVIKVELIKVKPEQECSAEAFSHATAAELPVIKIEQYAVKQECSDANEDAAALPVVKTELTAVKQECTDADAATDSFEVSCASIEHLKEEPADPDSCDEEPPMQLLRPCTVRLHRALVDECAASTPRATPDNKSHNNTHASSNSAMGQKSAKNQVRTKQFARKCDLTMHKKTRMPGATGSSYCCDTCDKTYNDKSKLVIHLRSHTGEQPYSCDVCQKRFSQKRNLTRHKETHMPDSMRSTYCCDTCNRRYKDKYQLVVHMRSHSGAAGKRYSCNVCRKQFVQLSDLTRHQRIHSGEKPYSCDVCQKRFSQNGNMHEHRKTHMPETARSTFSCGACSKKYSYKCHLITHMRRHTGEKPYCCDVCQKQFSDLSHFARHKRIHTGEKPYGCDVCQKRFARSSNLNQHKKSHTPDAAGGSYCCATCNKKCRDKYALGIHMRSHTGEKPYGCDVCQKRFARNSDANKHKKTHLTAARPLN